MASKEFQNKVGKVMDEWSKGALHSGSQKGPLVTNPKQAQAIAISEAQKATGQNPYPRGMHNLNSNLGPQVPSFSKGLAMPSVQAPEHETPGLMKNIYGKGMPEQYSPIQHSYAALRGAMRRKI